MLSPNRLHTILNSDSSIDVNSRLLSAPDRLIAMAAWACDKDLAERLMSRVAGAKRSRVREEYAMLELRQYRQEDVVGSLDLLVSHLQGQRVRMSGSWLRPLRPS
ncbi:hypothetical protein [Spirochaeta dissipatitropha]